MNNDVTYVLVLIAFFALSAAFVVACDKLIGSDSEALALGDENDPEPQPEIEELAA